MNRVFFFFGSWFSLFGMFDREVGNIRSGFQECRIDYSLVVPCEKKCWRIFTLTRSLMTNWQFVRRCLLCEWRRVYNVFSSRNWWGVPWWSPSSCKAHYRCKDFRNENHDRELFQQGLIHRVYRATSLFGSPKRGKKTSSKDYFYHDLANIQLPSYIILSWYWSTPKTCPAYLLYRNFTMHYF